MLANPFKLGAMIIREVKDLKLGVTSPGRKGEGFQPKGFPKGQNAEYFGKCKGCPPVNHFNITLICHNECNVPN